MKIEPDFIYYMRILFLFLTVSFQIVVMLIFVCLILFLCNMTVQTWKGDAFNPRSVSIRRVMRQGRLMNAMQYFPYSQFMLREASECPICLETFDSESQVIQL